MEFWVAADHERTGIQARDVSHSVTVQSTSRTAGRQRLEVAFNISYPEPLALYSSYAFWRMKATKMKANLEYWHQKSPREAGT